MTSSIGFPVTDSRSLDRPRPTAEHELRLMVSAFPHTLTSNKSKGLASVVRSLGKCVLPFQHISKLIIPVGKSRMMNSLPDDAIGSLESPASGNYSFYTARSLYQYVETPTETNSPGTENMCDFRRLTSSSSSLVSSPGPPTASSESLESRIYTTHVTSRSGTSTDTDSRRFENQHDLQSLTERSPRIIA